MVDRATFGVFQARALQSVFGSSKQKRFCVLLRDVLTRKRNCAFAISIAGMTDNQVLPITSIFNLPPHTILHRSIPHPG